MAKTTKITNQLKLQTKFYLLDSSNIQHLKEKSKRLPDVAMERVFEKVRLGLKAADKFMTNMTIQSLFDQRALFAKLINCFNNDGISNKIAEKHDWPTVCKVYSNCYLQNMLRSFHNDTSRFGNAGDL